MYRASASFSQQKPIKVLLADDEAGIISFLEGRFKSMEGFEVVGSAQTKAETVSEVKRLAPDLLILDNKFPDGKGLEILPILRREHPNLKVLMMTGQFPEETEKASFRSKAHGFLAKPLNDVLVLGEAVLTVLSGRIFYANGVLESDPHPKSSTGLGTAFEERLTKEDRHYIDLRLSGHSNAEIAKILKVEQDTINQKRHRICQRLGLSTDLESFLFERLNSRKES